MEITCYRDLKVWQLSMLLTELVYQVTATFPAQETYGLTSQARRAAVSIPSNVAEGHARDSTKEFLRFLSMAQGSLAELETQLILSQRLGFAGDANIREISSASNEVGRMLRALRKSLQAKLHLAPNP